MFDHIKSKYHEWGIRKRRKQFNDELLSLETIHKNKGTWQPSVHLFLQILSCIPPSLINENKSVHNELTFITGFRDIQHLINWINLFIQTVKNREALDYDITRHTYQRHQVDLDTFLNGTSAVSCINIMLAKFTLFNVEVNNITNPVYKDKIVYTFNQSGSDIFAIIETLCVLGAKDHE